ncbi:hypothetical protein A2707_01455 [Candidatus Saccharibacteria bacterium RIFCSPHIGHO2_01_FULL_45_15]|nr:MAG: hypothetical protein A2707_01455 [Candidatus Saccharibacteria bacterium RIFCSPHIGHO2_01_FULL_45_15]OGL32863.1 MAG: hypothetical protein A3E76_05865 [Candidatus Saccharibacteria bacterium RIFCSPHIGHO2_12_FULL_44_22]
MIEQMAQKQTSNKARRARTYARNRAAAAVVAKPRSVESDSTYFLKLVVVVILGTLWLKFSAPLSFNGFMLGAFPLGTVVGLAGIALIEKNQFDRKIWYAVLVVVSIICYFVPAGIVL